MSEPISSEEDLWGEIVSSFYNTAICQGRLAYCLMSIYAVNPNIFNFVTNYNLYPIIWANMIYGTAIMIMTRPSLRVIVPINRLSFGVFGSLMFNHSSMICYRWLSSLFPDRPYILSTLAFIAGRIMMIHLAAFLYHMDSRSVVSGSTVPRDYTFETMYT